MIHERSAEWYAVFAAVLLKLVNGMDMTSRRVLAPKIMIVIVIVIDFHIISSSA